MRAHSPLIGQRANNVYSVAARKSDAREEARLPPRVSHGFRVRRNTARPQHIFWERTLAWPDSWDGILVS